MQIAQTILDQLGGNRFASMTGAKNFIGKPNALQFSLPARFAKNKATIVEVELNEDHDLYVLRFYKFNRAKLSTQLIEEIDQVHVEDLRRVFTYRTGLDTSLGVA